MPVTICARSLCAIALPIFLLSPVSGLQAQSGAGQAVSNEAARRSNIFRHCEKAVEDGARLFASGEFKAALGRYRFVPEKLPLSPGTEALYRDAVNGIVACDIALAERAVKLYQFDEAKTYVDEAKKFRPEDAEVKALHERVYRELGLLSDTDEQDMNSATTPEFLRAVGQVSAMLTEVDQLRETGQFNRALDRAKQVLVIDPYNKSAREKIIDIERERQRYYRVAREQSREEMLYQVTQKWSEQPSRSILKGVDSGTAEPARVSNAARIAERLNSLTVDKVSFEDASVADAVDFLRRKAADLDAATPINFVLKASATILPAAPADAGVDAAAAPADATAVAPVERTITLDLQNLSLMALLDLVVKQAEMQYRIEDNAVYVYPAEDRIETLETREYRCPPSFIGNVSTTVSEGTSAADVANQAREAVKQKLTDIGVDFPEGATAVYLSAGSKLVVRNTPANLDLIQAAIEQESKVTPEVAIETRFIEINQDDLEEMTFRWNVNRRGTSQSQPTDTPGLRSSLPVSTEGIDVPRDLTVGGGGLTVNSVDSLLTQVAGAVSGVPLGSTLQHALTISRWKFEMLIYAMSQHSGADVLAVPKVTTRSGQEAEIKVTREFTYPEEYEPPRIDNTVSLLPDGSTIRLVTPSSPTSFTTEDTGVILTVNPQVGPDNLTIDLTLVPKVVAFEGFINYGSPVYSLEGPDILGGVFQGFGSAQLVQLADNVINKPVFSMRQVETKVQIADGQTVLMGGLIREDTQKVDDKLPFFGDLPLIGRAFRSKIDQQLKKNLMIFVTCNLVRPNGELFNKRPSYDDNSFRNTTDYQPVPRYEAPVDNKFLK